MEQQLQQCVNDLLQLATASGWTQAAAFAGKLLDSTAPPTLALIQLPQSDPELGPWLRRAAPRYELVDASTHPAGPDNWLADRVVVAFPCGGLPSASTLSDLANGPRARPQGSTLVALTGAEQIQSVEDLRLVEATAKRWLLPAEESGQPVGEIASAGGYLWTVTAISDPGRSDRVQRDLALMTRALNAALPAEVAAELDWRRVDFALNIAESEATRNIAPDVVEPRHRVYRIQNELSELRERVFTRVRSDTEALEAAIRVACDGLEHDLLAGLPRLIDSNPRALESSAAANDIFDRYCRDVLRTWEAQPHSAAVQWERAVGELKWLIESCDVWKMLASATGGDAFPERILTSLKNCGVLLHAPTTVPSPNSPRHGISSHSLVGTFATLIVGAGAGVLTGLGAPAIVAGAGLGWFVVDRFRRYSDAADLRREAIEAARQEISRAAKAARSDMSDIVAERTHQLRRELADSFAEAQQAADQVLQASSNQISQAAASREQLLKLRSRLQQLLRSNDFEGPA